MDPRQLAELVERIRFMASLVGGPSALARLLDLHRTTVFGYLKGDAEIPQTRLHVMAAKFPCSLEWLVEGKGEGPKADPMRTFRATVAGSNEAPDKPGRDGGRDLRLTPYNIVNATPGMDIFPRLDRVTARVQDLVKMLDAQQAEKAEKVLGAEFFALVVAGRAVPTRDVLIELAAALGVKPTWLLGLEE